MKFQFDSELNYQREAIDAVTDLFEGQDICQTNFTVARLGDDPQMAMNFGQFSGDLGVGNRSRASMRGCSRRNMSEPPESPNTTACSRR